MWSLARQGEPTHTDRDYSTPLRAVRGPIQDRTSCSLEAVLEHEHPRASHGARELFGACAFKPGCP